MADSVGSNHPCPIIATVGSTRDAKCIQVVDEFNLDRCQSSLSPDHNEMTYTRCYVQPGRKAS